MITSVGLGLVHFDKLKKPCCILDVIFITISKCLSYSPSKGIFNAGEFCRWLEEMSC